MKENYIKLIKACLPEALISALEEKSGLEKNKVESICLEIIARVFGDGSDLKRSSILMRLKENVDGATLKEILERIENKYGVSSSESGKVLEQLIPLFFKRISTLDDSYFDEEHPVQAIEKEEEIISLVQQESKEASVDDVYKNIEKRAEEENGEPKEMAKEKKSLFKKKEKKKKLEKDEIQGTIDSKELTIIEKICIWAVVVSLIALIGTIAFLFIRQSL